MAHPIIDALTVRDGKGVSILTDYLQDHPDEYQEVVRDLLTNLDEVIRKTLINCLTVNLRYANRLDERMPHGFIPTIRIELCWNKVPFNAIEVSTPPQ